MLRFRLQVYLVRFLSFLFRSSFCLITCMAAFVNDSLWRCQIAVQLIMGTAWSIGPIFNGFGAGTEKPGAILTQVRVSGAARDFYLSQLPVLPVQTHLLCPYSPLRAIACIILSAHFKNPKHIAWNYENTYCTHRNGQRCSYGCCALPGKAARISCNGQWSTEKIHSFDGRLWDFLWGFYFIYNNILTT